MQGWYLEALCCGTLATAILRATFSARPHHIAVRMCSTPCPVQVADHLVSLVVPLVTALRVGSPEDNADITPVISASSANFIEGLVKDAQEKGESCIYVCVCAYVCVLQVRVEAMVASAHGRRRICYEQAIPMHVAFTMRVKNQGCVCVCVRVCVGATFLTPYKREGNLLWPTLLDHVTPNMRIAWEEPFGPALPIMRYKDVQEAINHCNTSRLALQVRVVVCVCVCVTT